MGARIDPRSVPASRRGRSNATRKPAPVHHLREVEVVVPAPAVWCLGALLDSPPGGSGEVQMGCRTMRFELQGSVRHARGTKLVEVEPLRLRGWLVSGSLPWYEEVVDLVPAGPDGTRIRWSAAIDPGVTLPEKLRVMLARRWLARDARVRLRGIRQAAASTPIPRSAPRRHDVSVGV